MDHPRRLLRRRHPAHGVRRHGAGAPVALPHGARLDPAVRSGPGRGGRCRAWGGRRGRRGPAQRPLHPLRRQPGRTRRAVAGRPVTSATRLENWASCPFAYLMRNVLRVEEVENPEDELQITPRDKGSLVHQALEEFIGRGTGPPGARSTRPARTVVGVRPGPHGQHRRKRLRRLREPGPDRPPDLLAAGPEDGSSPTCCASSRPTPPTARPTGRGRWRPSWRSGSPAPNSAPSPSPSPTGGPSTSGASPTGSTWRTTAPSMSSTTRRARPTPTGG